MYIFIISRPFLLRMTSVTDKPCIENKKKLCSIIFFFENSAVYGIMGKDTVEPARPRMTIWGMRILCWIPKATNTHSEYVIIIAFPLQQWLHERSSVNIVRTLPVLLCNFLEGALYSRFARGTVEKHQCQR